MIGVFFPLSDPGCSTRQSGRRCSVLAEVFVSSTFNRPLRTCTLPLRQTTHSKHIATRVMFVRCWFVYLIPHLIDKVSLQDPDDILGYAGDSVILLCSYQERELKTEEINVFWRYNENIIVYNIEKGIPSTKRQNPKFKDRIDSFSSEYGNGNFSLRLSNLELTDTGQFSCSVPGVSMKRKLTLLVRAPPTTVPSTTASTPKSKSDT